MKYRTNNFQHSHHKFSKENKKEIAFNSQSLAHHVSYDALVLDAKLWQSLSVVRSLGNRGLQVVALETYDSLPAPAFSSRWCQQKVVCSAHEGTKEYLTFLEQVLDVTKPRVLIASSDGTIALLRQHREQLEPRVRIALAKEPALGIALNKGKTLAIAQQLGLTIPRGVSVSAVSEVDIALREIGLPGVVKPAESWVGSEQQGTRVASQLVTTRDEARHAVEMLTQFGGKVLFQQFLPGRRESVSFFYANGKVYAGFAYWGKRTAPPLGGLAVVRQSISMPWDTSKQAERLVREIELEGYSQIEFRRDSVGKPYLMEINPRLNAGIELAVCAGVNFPYMLYQWANGDRIDVVKGYQTGRWMRHLGGDFATTIATVLQQGRPGVAPPAQAILDFCTSFFVPMQYSHFDWKDPLPAWTATIGFARSSPQMLLNGLFKKVL